MTICFGFLQTVSKGSIIPFAASVQSRKGDGGGAQVPWIPDFDLCLPKDFGISPG